MKNLWKIIGFCFALSMGCHAQTSNSLSIDSINSLPKKEIVTKPDGIKVTIAYRREGKEFILAGDSYFVITDAYFLINGKIAGKIDVTGIFDKSGIQIYKNKGEFQFIGICSDLLMYPGSPSYIYKEHDKLFIGNTAAVLQFDETENTIRLLDCQL